MASSVEADRFPAMCGNATLATEESSTTMNVAVITAVAIAQGLADGAQGSDSAAGARCESLIGPTLRGALWTGGAVRCMLGK